jgi:hypothetical protein
MLFGCFQNTDENNNSNNTKTISVVDSLSDKGFVTDTLNRFQFTTKKGDTVKVSFHKDTLYVKFNNKDSQITIPFSAPIDNIIPCNCLAVKKRNGQFDYESYYLYKDSLLLLPVLDFDGRINLFVINTFNRRVLPVHKPRESYMLNTYLTWFVFNEKSGVITTSNSLDLDGKTMIHTFKITKSELTYLKSINKQSNLNIYSDEEKMKEYIKRIAK